MADETQSNKEGQSRFAVPEGAVLTLLGSRDENLRLAEDLLDADVHVRGNEITLSGAPADVAFAERVFSELSRSPGAARPSARTPSAASSRC